MGGVRFYSNLNRYFIPADNPIAQFSFKTYWLDMLNAYNHIFDENKKMSDVERYSEGLRTDTQDERSAELADKDAHTIGSELVESIWGETDEKLALMIGAKIWQDYEQITQPFLDKILTDYD